MAVKFVSLIAYVLLAPFLGGLLNGFDRRISARMQSRAGPPLLQPFYDLGKLWRKETAVINHSQNFFVIMYLVFMMFTGAIFYWGSDLLLVMFALTLASIFFVLSAYSTNSPYSSIGADRELLGMLADEPVVLLTGVGFYLASGSFAVSDILNQASPALFSLPGVFIAYCFILTIKYRKSPFDISSSHHGHQEIVKGITTEFSGRTLALVELTHWYESILLLGLVFLFFACRSWTWGLTGVAAALAVYFLQIVLDNTFARVKWPVMLFGSWLVALVFAMTNLLVIAP